MITAKGYQTAPTVSLKSEHCSLINKMRSLPKPKQWFKGYSGMFSVLPTDIAIFSGEKYMDHFDNIEHRYVIALCLKEKSSIIINDKKYHLSPGWGKMIFPKQQHSFSDSTEYTGWLFISFKMDAEKELLPLKDYPFEIGEEHFKVINRMFTSYRNQKTLESGESQNLVFLLTELLYKLTTTSFLSKNFLMDRLATLPLSDKKLTVSKINRFIYENIGDSIQAQDISKFIHKSESYVRKAVREVTGFSVRELIHRTQFYKSCNLLKYSDQTVEEIAEESGFYSVHSFSRSFSLKMGLPPIEYRKNFQSKG